MKKEEVKKEEVKKEKNPNSHVKNTKKTIDSFQTTMDSYIEEAKKYKKGITSGNESVNSSTNINSNKKTE